MGGWITAGVAVVLGALGLRIGIARKLPDIEEPDPHAQDTEERLDVLRHLTDKQHT